MAKTVPGASSCMPVQTTFLADMFIGQNMQTPHHGSLYTQHVHNVTGDLAALTNDLSKPLTGRSVGAAAGCALPKTPPPASCGVWRNDATSSEASEFPPKPLLPSKLLSTASPTCASAAGNREKSCPSHKEMPAFDGLGNLCTVSRLEIRPTKHRPGLRLPHKASAQALPLLGLPLHA
eukprot:scaffold225797_cov32-Prasinocladus_malaysianus.AAC.1